MWMKFMCIMRSACASCDLHTWSLQWRHNERDGVSNHQPHDCLLNRLFRRRSKKTSKLRVTDLCAGHQFPAQRARNTENVSIWWRHRDAGTHDCGPMGKWLWCCPSIDRPRQFQLIWFGVNTQMTILSNGLTIYESSPHSAAYMRQWIRSALVHTMACRLFGAKPSSKPMLCYCQFYWTIRNKLRWNYNQNRKT